VEAALIGTQVLMTIEVRAPKDFQCLISKKDRIRKAAFIDSRSSQTAQIKGFSTNHRLGSTSLLIQVLTLLQQIKIDSAVPQSSQKAR